MKASLPGIVIVTVVGLSGLALGFMTSGQHETKNDIADSPQAHEGGFLREPSDGKSPVFAADAPEKTFERLLSVIANGGKKQVYDALQEVLSDPTLPPLPAGIYRNALLSRMAKLGNLRELLDSGDFPASQRPDVVTAFTRFLAEKDVTAARAFLKQLNPPDYRAAAPTLLAVLAREDPKRGLALLAEDPAMRAFTGAFYGAWAQEDPKAATAAALEVTVGEFQSVLYSTIGSWAIRDPDAAWNWIASAPSDRQAALKKIYFATVAQTDPARALEVMATNPEFSDAFQAQWIGIAIARNVEEANVALNRLPPGRGRNQLISGLASSLASQPKEALAWASTLLPGEREIAIKELFTGLGTWNPDEGIDLAMKNLTGTERQTAIGSIVAGWALRDFDAAFQAMITKLDRDSMRTALENVFLYHSVRDDAETGKYIAAIAALDPESRADVLRKMGESWGGRPGAMAQMQALGTADRVAFAEGAIDPRFVMNSKPLPDLVSWLPPEKQAKYAGNIATAMARDDLSGAAEFLARLPDGGEKGKALEGVVYEWGYQEPAIASTFVGRLPAGDARDHASRALVRSLRTFDLDQATRVADLIGAGKTRNEVIGQLAADWALSDPTRGRKAMAPLLQTEEERGKAAVLFEDQ